MIESLRRTSHARAARNEAHSPTSKVLPLYPIVPRPKCPICGQASYSKAGIHPQCNQERSDTFRLTRPAGAAKLPVREPLTKPSSPWYKSCPNCGKPVHVQRKACICGQSLRV